MATHAVCKSLVSDPDRQMRGDHVHYTYGNQRIGVGCYKRVKEYLVSRTFKGPCSGPRPGKWRPVPTPPLTNCMSNIDYKAIRTVSMIAKDYRALLADGDRSITASRRRSAFHRHLEQTALCIRWRP